MSPAVAKLIPALDQLTVDERAQVLSYLMPFGDDEPGASDAIPDEAWAEELDRREALRLSGEDPGVDGREYIAALRRKHGL